jgi:8-oxo-dGTP pyrophosphatase MutT (NUDIX family)
MGLRDGDRFSRCGQGHVHWGRYGAAGLLPFCDGHVLLQRRARMTPGGGTWGLFGGAIHSDESPVAGALREAAEECTLPTESVRVHGSITDDHGNWAYHTVFATVSALVDVRPASWETAEARWVSPPEVPELKLFPPFGAIWPRLAEGLRRPVVVVDCANVMGSRADGWWKDRPGGARRLRDQLAAATLSPVEPYDTWWPELVLVVEGKARGIGSAEPVLVMDAPASGDDLIVDLVTHSDPDSRHFVVTADRELRARCEAEGAELFGPRWLLSQLD